MPDLFRSEYVIDVPMDDGDSFSHYLVHALNRHANWLMIDYTSPLEEPLEVSLVQARDVDDMKVRWNDFGPCNPPKLDGAARIRFLLKLSPRVVKKSVNFWVAKATALHEHSKLVYDRNIACDPKTMGFDDVGLDTRGEQVTPQGATVIWSFEWWQDGEPLKR